VEDGVSGGAECVDGGGGDRAEEEDAPGGASGEPGVGTEVVGSGGGTLAGAEWQDEFAVVEGDGSESVGCGEGSDVSVLGDEGGIEVHKFLRGKRLEVRPTVGIGDGFPRCHGRFPDEFSDFSRDGDGGSLEFVLVDGLDRGDGGVSFLGFCGVLVDASVGGSLVDFSEGEDALAS
jgi:hypothetical protein